MDVLIQYGFSIEEIQNMLDTNFLIESCEDQSISELLELLTNIGCSNQHIQNIFICNPFCLTNSIEEIKKLIDKLYEIGYDTLCTLFDSNPYLLNITARDLDNFYHKVIHEGIPHEEFLDYLNYHYIY